LSEEKPLYVGRFYNYDNIDELNNNEDLIKNVALRVLSVTPSNTWKLLSAVEYHIPGAVNGMVAPAGNPSLILLTTGGTVTLLNSNNTSNLTYTLSEEKPLYVGRFYNYDNIDELNNNEDLIIMFPSSSSDKKLLAVFASAYNDRNSVITFGKLLISLSILSMSLNFKALLEDGKIPIPFSSNPIVEIIEQGL
jgi:hypothetical protein